jgi:hypothetical protein
MAVFSCTGNTSATRRTNYSDKTPKSILAKFTAHFTNPPLNNTMTQMTSSAPRCESPTEAPPRIISLTYSQADQSFVRTKTVGIFNVSLDLLQVLARRPELTRPPPAALSA